MILLTYLENNSNRAGQRPNENNYAQTNESARTYASLSSEAGAFV